MVVVAGGLVSVLLAIVCRNSQEEATTGSGRILRCRTKTPQRRLVERTSWGMETHMGAAAEGAKRKNQSNKIYYLVSGGFPATIYARLILPVPTSPRIDDSPVLHGQFVCLNPAVPCRAAEQVRDVPRPLAQREGVRNVVRVGGDCRSCRTAYLFDGGDV